MSGKIWKMDGHGDKTALRDERGAKLTYAEASEECGRIYRAVSHRCLMFILCENSVGSVLGYVSALENGVVPVMLSARLERGSLDGLLRSYLPEYIWMPERMADGFGAMAPVYSCHGYALLRTGYGAPYPMHDGLALLLATSGSTGSPKFVRQSYGNVRANTESIVEYLGLDSGEKAITTLPMNYTYGLSIINTHLSVGATVLLTDKGLTQKEFWRFFKERGATSFGGVPYTYEMLDRLRFYRMDLPSLRTMTQAGGKLAPELHEKFAEHAKERGRKFLVMYGQCEATARMGYLPSEKAVEKKGSMGIAIPGGKFSLIGADGEEIAAPHTTGELVYEGPNVTLGYAESGADLMKGDERGGVLATGDMAQFDEDGYYYIVGRKKRFLKIYGNRVNLDEMEGLIKGEFGIDAACAGVDDHMCVFLEDGGRADDVKAFASRKTGLNPSAFKVVVLKDIPKNDAGKTRYAELERLYG